MNPPTEHPNRVQLAAFLSGQLDAVEQAVVTSHIEGCDVCCQVLRDIPDDEFLQRVREANTPGSRGNDPCETQPHHQPVPKELSEHPRYKIGRFLGAGGMGLVYQAEHRLMDRVVALKVIHRDLIRRPRVVERFRLEVKAAARLAHPNIVAAYDAEQAGDLHFLVMEFVDGMSLAGLVEKKGPLEIAYACNFIRQAARGLQHAFEAGMVHRDIKPHNLMLTRKGQIKILDFGLARLASETRADRPLPLSPGASRPELTKMGDVMGTPDFMAPEQFVDASKADIRADLYSLGCTLYYLLTGKSPFAAAPVSVARKTRLPKPITDCRADLPAEIVTILNKLLERDAARRYQTPAELVKVLAPFSKPAPVPAREEARAAPTPTPALAGFLAQCPFCMARLRVPDKALGASIPCPHCRSSFTAVPAEDEMRQAPR